MLYTWVYLRVSVCQLDDFPCNDPSFRYMEDGMARQYSMINHVVHTRYIQYIQYNSSYGVEMHPEDASAPGRNVFAPSRPFFWYDCGTVVVHVMQHGRTVR